MCRSLCIIVGSLVLTTLAGCAHMVVDTDGTRHVTGFVLLTLPPVQQEVGADVVRMRSIGLTVTGGHTAGSQVTLGYSDTFIAAMRNDSAISRTTLQRAMGEKQQRKEE